MAEDQRACHSPGQLGVEDRHCPNQLGVEDIHPQPSPPAWLGGLPLHLQQQQQQLSSGGAPEGTNNKNSFHAGQPDGGTPDSPSGHRHGQQGVAARRFFCFPLRRTCCRLSTNRSTSQTNLIFKIVDNQGRTTVKTVGQAIPPAFYANLEGAAHQGGQPRGAGGWPEAGCGQLQGTAVPEMHTSQGEDLIQRTMETCKLLSSEGGL